MNRGFVVSLLALLVMLVCMIGYQMSPNYVAEDGTLVEAFGFIPVFRLAGLVLVIGLSIGIVSYTRNKKMS